MSDQQFSAGRTADDPLEALYYAHDGSQTLGPMKGAVVRNMLDSGALRPDNDICKVGDTTWVRISEMSFLSGRGTAAAPLPGSASFQPATLGGGREFGGFWIRLGAYLIDAVFLYIITLVISFVFGVCVGLILTSAGTDATTIREISGIGGGILGLVLAIGYYVGFVSSNWQATPGKRLLGLYVMRSDGSRISRLRSLGRYFSMMVSSLTLCIGFLMIAWTDEKKGLHDIIADTRVVRGRPGPSAQSVVDAF